MLTLVVKFADTRTAYDDLSEDMKKRLDGLVANHSLFHSRKTAQPEYFQNTDPMKLPLSRHKLVQKHEWSGRMVSAITRDRNGNISPAPPESIHRLLRPPH